MKKVFDILMNNPAVDSLIRGTDNIIVSDISEEAYLLACSYLKAPRNYVVIKSNLLEAQELYQQLSFLLKGNCLFFPVDESLRVEALASSPEMLAERINTYYQLSLKQPKVLITFTTGVIRYSPSASSFSKKKLILKTQDTYKIKELRRTLVSLGYQYMIKVDQAFYYSYRGGIIDIFSINYEYPIRIEFFDDEIESIRFYDPETQRSLKAIDEIVILPATELFYEKEDVYLAIEELSKIKDHSIKKLDETTRELLDTTIQYDFDQLISLDQSPRLYQYYPYIARPTSILEHIEDPIIVLSNYSDIKDNYQLYIRENDSYTIEMYESGKSLYPINIYQDIDSLLDCYHKIVNFDNFKTNSKQVEFKARGIDPFFDRESDVIKQIKHYLMSNKVFIVLSKEHQLKNIGNLLGEHQIPYHFVSDFDPLYEGVNLYLGDLTCGIELIEEKTIILTPKELIGEAAVNKTKFIKYKNAKIIKNFEDLGIGDYIVHDTHGIGQYLGIKTLEIKGGLKDYLYISYKGNDTLYLPVEQFRMIRKHTSYEGKIPKINKLGGTEWAKTKQKIRKKIEDIADALIALYAERLSQPGFAFKEDGNLQYQFEADFGHELTFDQKNAVNEIKEDMQKPQPMDRLLCGDVGFGKTEVALRAAFKAIESNKQVAILCPTTILSSQHYQTIKERFKRYPINIALLNRFVSPKEQKEIMEKIKNGQIDFLIGTHRILSKDIKFKDIGLLIVDEEQRFGVKHKEKIKEYKQTIDVLTLTATPIPRTLQMSLMGIRGLSTIDTPPKDRVPVQTYVVEKDWRMIKQVIERELARGGQVFYLYNKTEYITRVAKQLIDLIPQAKVGVGHGKMDKLDLESVMTSFINKEFNVLVCTTIVETGIDIPNANTMIIEDADRFGLSQLYQIKGRVGRSNRHAYAYLLYKADKKINDEARKRLKAIKEFTELGSGYKIAMRDLTIRGAGDILGGEQAGFIDSVGFDMYMQILQETINEKKGIKKEEEKQVPAVNISNDGYIPEDYVNSDLEKLYLYQQLNRVVDILELDEIRSELKDFYGDLPKVVSNLVDKREFDILNSINQIKTVLEKKKQVEITFNKDFSSQVDGVKLWDLIYKISKHIKISYLNQLIILAIPKDDKWLFYANNILRRVNEVTKI